MRFRIWLSDDLRVWEEVLDEGLELPGAGEPCGGLELFELAEKKGARYLRFQDFEHDQAGPSLAFFGILEGGE